MCPLYACMYIVQLMAGYDVLHIQEQQFLKCCAVLGDSFRRSKLLFVWKCTDTRKFNLGMNVIL